MDRAGRRRRHIAARRLAARLGGDALFLHVDSDTPKSTTNSTPARLGGRVTRVSHRLPAIEPDILIIDFNLPGAMDGAELAEEVCRAMGHCIPTILLSGELANAEMPWMPGVPVLPLSKPADPELLLKAVETFGEFELFAAAKRRAHA